jgi:predicted  nucleic acid-binding Zn-ribbon protein
MSYLDQIKYLKDELQKERRKNADLDRQVKAYKGASSVTGQKERDRLEKEHETLKRDYNQLLDAFQRSESIR